MTPKFDTYFPNPSEIADDWAFSLAARDETFHDVEVQYVVETGPNLASIALLVALVVAMVSVVLLLTAGMSRPRIRRG